MPLYDYKCKHCGHVFSKSKTIHAKTTDSRCPKCKKKCHAIIGAPGFKVRGGTPKFHR